MSKTPTPVIRQARVDDIPAIREIIRLSARIMQASGNPTWSEAYPSDMLITEDVEARHVLVGTLDDRVIGCIAFDAEQVGPEHHHVHWLLETDDPRDYTFLNRLAVHPDYRGRSIASHLIDVAERAAERRGSRSLRLDVWPGSAEVYAMYQRRGYVPVGTVTYRDITPPFHVLERLIPPCQFLLTYPGSITTQNILSLESDRTQESGHDIIEEALHIRRIVFIEGQGVPETIERDGREHEAFHLLALRGTTPAGSLRMRPIDNDTDHPGAPYLKLERIAVLPEQRGRGYGQRLVREAVRIAPDLGYTTLRMHAQYYLLEFYRDLGFTPEGDIFSEADIPHISMHLTL